jgi:phage-related holin
MREISSIGAFLTKMFADMVPLKWPLALLVGAVGYVLPEQGQRDAAVAAVGLVVLDTATGLVAGLVSGEAVTSARFGRVLVKLLGYGSVVVVVAVANRSLGIQGAQSATVATTLGLIIATEAISILENVRKMGINLPFGIGRLLEERLKAPTHALVSVKEPEETKTR